ncbi:MAG: DUF5060 domain-containing protein [Lentisphaeria bacterium]|jgi:hypothetical protein
MFRHSSFIVLGLGLLLGALGALPAAAAATAAAAGTAASAPTLAAAVFPGTLTATERLAAEGLPGWRAQVPLALPAGAPLEGMQAAFFLKDKDGLWFQTAWQAVAVAAPAGGGAAAPPLMLEFDLAPASGQVRPEGHGAAWNGYYARHVAEVGVRLFSPAAWQGQVTLGPVAFPAGAAGGGDDPLRLHRFEWLTAPPAQAWRQAELAFELDGFAGNPFDPDQVTVDAEIEAPGGTVVRRPAFYAQEYRRRLDAQQAEVITPQGRGGWRLRFTPLAAGNHRWRLLVKVADGRSLATAWHRLAVAPGAARGFVRVSPKDPRFFETADGKWFQPRGLHIHSPFDRRSTERLGFPMPPDSGTYHYDRYFERLAANGANTVIVWMSSWWLAIEWNRQWQGYFGVNDYNLGNGWRLDYLLEQAERRGLYLILMIDNHGKFSSFCDAEWRSNPLNRRLGGPLATPEELFTTERGFQEYAKRLRYIAARWGQHPRLLGWLLFSEIDLCGASGRFRHDPSMVALCARARDYLNAASGLARPAAVQYSGTWRTVAPAMAAEPKIDVLMPDAYKGDESQSIVPLMQATATKLGEHGKPVMVAEYGGSWRGATPDQLEADFHAALWSAAMSSAAGAPFFWWYDFVDRNNLYFHYRGLAAFLDEPAQDPRGRGWRHGEVAVEQEGGAKGEVRGVAYWGADGGRAWAYDRLTPLSLELARARPPQAGVCLQLDGVQPGAWRLEFWDTLAAKVVQRKLVQVGADGRLRLEFPPFQVDQAVRFQRLPE